MATFQPVSRTYDITSAIPKSAYRVSLSNALDLDGMRVAPFSNTTFNVDYAGFISDKTPPATPAVTASGGGAPNDSLRQLEQQRPGITHHTIPLCHWHYPRRGDVVAWTYVSSATTSMTRTGFNLTYGQPYYVTVGARNEGGLWSDDGVSNGVIAGVAPSPTPTQTLPPAPLPTPTRL